MQKGNTESIEEDAYAEIGEEVYNDLGIEEQVDADSISPAEAGFMSGWLEGDEDLDTEEW